MSKTVKLGKTVIGEGLPKICVPIVGKNKEEVFSAAAKIVLQGPDVIEWRLDFLKDTSVSVIEDAGILLKKVIGKTPLLATFRTKAEGGEKEIAGEDYEAIYTMLIEKEIADAIDVELFLDQELVQRLIEKAHQNQVAVIGSNHEFHATPAKEVIVERLCKMQELGMDIAKMAVMPKDTSDLLTLLTATNEMKEQHPQTPVITMSMSGKGVLSRLSGEIFGSALTFGTVGKASAPGQVPVTELKSILQMIHDFS